ncbi:MAG: hypothetical protein M5R36_00175 [Deltaproteobacteria bacterium]|nr:hypothetical protein [Deltaproteobacteria bacterium]
MTAADPLAPWTTETLGASIPVDLALPREQAEAFDFSSHEVAVRGRLVVMDNEPIALDLVGLSGEEGAAIIRKHPRVASLRVDSRVLCDPQIAAAVNDNQSPYLALRWVTGPEAPVQGGCLRRLNKVALFLALPGGTDRSLRELAGFDNLRELRLSGRNFSPLGLGALASLVNLNRLDLADTNANDLSMESIGRLRGLRDLNLWSTEITDKGLSHLADLWFLERLEIGGTEVGDAGVARLAGLANLRYLGLGLTHVTDRGVKRLSNLKSLESLELWSTKLADDGLAALAGAIRAQRPSNLVHRRHGCRPRPLDPDEKFTPPEPGGHRYRR